MGLKTIIIIDHQTNENQTDLDRNIQATNRASAGLKLDDFFTKIGSGILNTKIFIGTGAGQATATVTLATHLATHTVTINGVVFTCVASGAVANQYNVGGTDALSAVALAASINTSVTVKIAGDIIASVVGAVVTLTCVDPTSQGNNASLAISAGGSVSGALFTGGTDGATQNTWYFGSSQ